MTGIRDTLGTLKVSLFGGSKTYQYWAEPSVLYIERCPLFGVPFLGGLTVVFMDKH